MLETIAQLSRACGGENYVLGGGGNSSCKDGSTLWIKPSGASLAEMTPRSFIAMERQRLQRLYEIAPPADPVAREALVKETMAAAVKPQTPGRASVETPVHNAFEARYVVHTHPTLANGLACSLGGAAAAARLFPEALWLPYVDPGYTLGMRVRRELDAWRQRHGGEPRLMWLENHGVFVAADAPAEIMATYDHLMATLSRHYSQAGVPEELRAGQAPSPERAAIVAEALRAALGAAASQVLAAPPTDCAAGPVTPDHLVYARAFVYEGTLEPAALRAFVERRGYAPRAVALPGGIFGLGSSPREASLALAFARDAARIRQLARAFGGVQYLADAARDFLENWEVESYRARQMA